MSTSKTYLITGANRGLGRGLTEALLQRPNTTIIAGVRDLTSPTSQSLSTLSTAPGSRVIPVLISSTDDASPFQAIETLRSTHHITHLDIVIANAGISEHYAPASSTSLAEVRSHFNVNAVGVLALYQAVLPLLKNSASKPVFVAISTGGASIGAMEHVPIQATAYGMSKVALNYLVKRIHLDEKDLIAFALSPGWVQTDMGNAGAAASGLEEAPVKLEDSVKGMLGKIDNATREETSGTFQSFDDEKYPW
ncbi:hypothetical protein CJF32_00009410 [Rutstroemia sp. NJR-2017a WRK4]|nr:hypothetical protein CJF32_00009410 [Rutstroemia sp. NJR-2017a WRK4]